MDSRRMSPGSVPHCAIHFLPLMRAQKERSCQRDEKFTRSRTTSESDSRTEPSHPCALHVNARPRVPLPCNVHCALDDASEHTAPHHDWHVDLCGPLAIDMWGRARASLVV